MTLYRTLLLDPIRTQAAAHPAKVALIEAGRGHLAYGALVATVDTVATNLIRRGFRPGDRVLVLVRPGLPAVVLLLAILRAGGVAVVCDIAMGQEVFAGRVRAAAPRWVFVESLLLALQPHAWVRHLLKARGIEIPEIPPIPGIRSVAVGPRLPGLVRPAFHYADLCRTPGAPAAAGAELPQDPEADALIVFTSGTTGLPRGVVHSQASLAAALALIVTRLAPDPADVFYADVLHLVIPALAAGACAVIPPPGTRPPAALAHLHHYRATKTYGVPAEFEELIETCRARRARLPATLDTIMLGSAPVPLRFLERLRAVVAPGTAIWTAYGTTEMLPICAVSLADKQAFAGAGDLVGPPLPGVQVRLAPDGELLARGPNLCRRYLDGPPLDELATGDLARLDPSGNVVLIGRKKDMIIKGNHNIYPTLIESTVSRIAGVRTCALVGIYREDRSDEEIVLVVDKADPRDDETYRRFLAAALLTGPHSIDLYAQPDRIVFAPLPTGGRSRKVDKQRLRAWLRGEGAGGPA
jgi:acyl-CoA synthetase (AMP-forming)/AMP-acid ligase II